MLTNQKLIHAIFSKALGSVNPSVALKQRFQRDGNLLTVTLSEGKYKTIKLDKVNNVYVVGCGKATALMAETIEDILGPNLTAGVISVKYDHLSNKRLRKIDLVEAGHPEPDNNGINAASRVFEMLENANEQDLVIALLSGGGSALWPLPVNGITLEDKIATTKVLLESGATIKEINTVRKCLSKIKGGKAAIAAYPAKMLVFMISDVENDDPSIIASGPFAIDKSKEEDIQNINKKYSLSNRLPKNVSKCLLKSKNEINTYNKEPIFDKITNCICSNNTIMLEAAVKEAEKAGYHVTNVGSVHFGEAKSTAKNIINKVKDIYDKNPDKKHCIISGGETTVILGQSYGKGGRNQEFALAAAIELDRLFTKSPCKVTLLSCGTDGTDGPTDAAGAIVDTETVSFAKSQGLNHQKALENHDAYPFFNKINALVKTGPTNTNVMDIQIAIIDR